MPNWCTTSYALIGERKEVRSLYNKMKRLQERKTPIIPNGFGVAWLGCLVKSLGKDPKGVYCRGRWYNLKLSDEGVLTFDTEHAWSRPVEVEMLIESAFPSVKIYFLEEELGMPPGTSSSRSSSTKNPKGWSTIPKKRPSGACQNSQGSRSRPGKRRISTSPRSTRLRMRPMEKDVSGYIEPKFVKKKKRWKRWNNSTKWNSSERWGPYE